MTAPASDLLVEELPFVEELEGDVTLPAGFRAAGVHCGLKSSRPDLAILLAEGPASAAGVFTTNRMAAAPVRYSRRAVARGRARAVVVNAGNANACTGPRGEEDAREMARRTAERLSLETADVLVASTGLIGVPLPMDRIRCGIDDAAGALSDPEHPGHGGAEAALAILTTDRGPKTAAARVRLGTGTVTIGGIAKGAGMIHPRLATTLAFLTTDAAVTPPLLRRALREAVEGSFNAITVDGETSTNDAVLALAGGRGPAGPILETGPELERFTAGLARVAGRLARMVVRDGEGATKLVTVRVQGAASAEEARRAADRLAGSLLVRTALHGEQANWGRILAALGTVEMRLEPGRVSVTFGEVPVVREGRGVEGALAAAGDHLRGDDILLTVDLGLGTGEATIWTCDLGHEYVRVNASYAS